MNYHVTCDINNEILIKNDDVRIYLDPKKILCDDFVFISHAHTDHLLNKLNLKKFNLKNKIISSPETSIIAGERGYLINEFLGSHRDFRLIDSGHIIGSKGLVIDENIFYTGDISTRKRAFLRNPRIPKAEILIIESTFGRPQYKFPSIEKISHSVNSLISEMYSRGIPVILMGYSLGKAQILTSLFGTWKPFIVHDEIYQFNKIYRDLGIKLEDSIPLSEAKEQNLLNNKPWLMIHPLRNGKHNSISYLKKNFGAVTIGFSGWAVNKNYAHIMNLDYVFPFSDHCDFDELVEVVRVCNPSKVYTFHGFQNDFAKYLTALGYKAEAISNLGSSNKFRTELRATSKSLNIHNNEKMDKFM